MRLEDVARDALSTAMNFGFDETKVLVKSEKELVVRVANSAVCRENVLREQQTMGIECAIGKRHGSFQVPLNNLKDLSGRFARFADQLKVQPEDQEYCEAKTVPGHQQYNLAETNFLTNYDPVSIYGGIEKGLSKVRQKDLRGTGCVVAAETENFYLDSRNCSVAVYDNGLTSDWTIDHPQQIGASGSSSEATLSADRNDIANLLEKTIDDATKIATMNRDPGSLSPGDYTVILHPRAVADIVRTSLMYQMFDCRMIDEGRTYLGKHKNPFAFPKGLELRQDHELSVGSKTYQCSTLNARMVPCDPVKLIEGGLVGDKHTSPYWAQKTGVKESHTAYYGPPLQMNINSSEGFEEGLHQDLAAMIADTESGIFVANTWYLRMVSIMDGTITGMTRDGVFEIKDGKITRPLNNMRWHENPFRVLSAAVSATKDRQVMGLSRWAGRSRGGLSAFPALKVRDFHFSSETRF